MTNLARTAALLAAVAAAVLGLGLRPGPAQAQAAGTRTVVYGFGGHCPTGKWGRPKIRPRSAFFSFACENGVRAIRWRDWRAASAYGHGSVLTFNGSSLAPHRGTIRLSAVRRHDGRRYFSHLVMKWTTKGGKRHKEVLSWKKNGSFWMWIGNYQ